MKPTETPDLKLKRKVLAAKEARETSFTRDLATNLAANNSLEQQDEWQNLPIDSLTKSGQFSQSKKVAGKRLKIFSRTIDVQSFSLAGTSTKLDIKPLSWSWSPQT